MSTKIEGLSRSRAQELISDGYFKASGKTRKPSYRLSVGEMVEGECPKPVNLAAKPVNIPLDIVYEDNELIVINKPKNMVVHPACGHFDDTLVNALLYHCGDSLSGINGVMRPGIVHRIDKDTTGLLVAAKTNEAHIFLSDLLKSRELKRVYEAISFGVLKDDEGVISAPIGRHQTERVKMCVNEKNGKDALTRYRVIRRFKKYTYIEAALETGRTHQIRVHMSYIGHPILGDSVYSRRKQPFGLRSQVLHAKTLSFPHPKTGEPMSFNSELPEYFKECLRLIDE